MPGFFIMLITEKDKQIMESRFTEFEYRVGDFMSEGCCYHTENESEYLQELLKEVSIDFWKLYYFCCKDK
jgi:hypothetical protein